MSRVGGRHGGVQGGAHSQGGCSHGQTNIGGGAGVGQGHIQGQGGGQGQGQFGQNTLIIVVLLHGFPVQLEPFGPPGGVLPDGGTVGGTPGVVGGIGATFSCDVSTLVSVFACANTLTFAAAFAPLLAFDDVAILVLTLVLVNVCDSELVSVAVAAPVSEPAAVLPPLDELDSALFLPVSAGFSFSPIIRLKEN